MDVGLAAAAIECLGVLARCAGFVATATWPVFPGACLRVRGGLAVVLAAAAMPAALGKSVGGQESDLPVAAVLTEILVGTVMGTAVACVLGSAAWAVGMMAAASGVAGGDSADPQEGGGAGFARLAWWIAVGGFLSAGGSRLVLGGLLDSFQSLPVGGMVDGAGGIAVIVRQLPGTAFTIAVSLALPAVLAILAFHATAAIAIRATALSPGQGMMQSAAGLVLLGMLYASAGSWTTAFPSIAGPAVERCLAPSADGGDRSRRKP